MIQPDETVLAEYMEPGKRTGYPLIPMRTTVWRWHLRLSERKCQESPSMIPGVLSEDIRELFPGVDKSGVKILRVKQINVMTEERL